MTNPITIEQAQIEEYRETIADLKIDNARLTKLVSSLRSSLFNISRSHDASDDYHAGMREYVALMAGLSTFKPPNAENKRRWAEWRTERV